MNTETNIKGIEYEEVKRETVDAIEQRHANIVPVVRKNGTTARLVLKRPRGKDCSGRMSHGREGAVNTGTRQSGSKSP